MNDAYAKAMAMAARADRAAAAGARHKVFDWDKAAELIRLRKPKSVEAGLTEDWSYTGGTIYEDGRVVLDSYTYLKSNWATPVIVLDGEEAECWRYRDETEWDSHTKWPASALHILNTLEERTKAEQRR